MSRGTTRRSAFGRRMRTVPNSSRSVTNARPSGPPTNPPLRLRSIEGDRARRRRLPHPLDDRDRVAGLAQHVGQPRRLVRGEDDPGVVGSPGLDGLDKSTGTAGRQDGLAPPERVARRERAAGHRDVLGRDRLPGQLEGPRGDEAALPVARRQVGRRPVLGQLAGLDQLGAALVGLAPQEAGGLGDVAGLVEHEQGARTDVVEAGRRGEVGGPDLGGVADGHRPARVRARGRPRAVRRRTGRGPRRGAPEVARRPGRGGRGSRRHHPRGSRNSDAGRRIARSIVPVVRWSVGSNERSESISSPKNSIRIGSAIEGGKTSTIPPRRAELAPARDLADRHVAEVEQLAQQGVLVDPRADAAARAARAAGRPGRSCAGGATGRWPPGCAPARSATRRGPRPGRRSRRRSARCVRRPARTAAPARRRPPGRRARRRVPRRPDRRSPRRGRSRRGARHRRPGRGSRPGRSWRRAGPRPARRGGPVRRGSSSVRPRRSRSAANVPVAASSGGRAERSGRRWPPGLRPGCPAVRPLGAGARPWRRARLLRCAPGVIDLGIDRGDVEVDLVVGGCRRVACREVGRDSFGDPAVAAAAAAERRVGHGQASDLGGRIRRQPVRVRRIPSASGGPSTSPAAASRVVSAGRSSNMLKRLAALLVPSRAHASTASAAASSSSSSRCCSSGAKCVRTWSTALRSGSPMPIRSRLNFSVPSSSMIEPQAVVAARAAALAEAQLAEGQREVVGDDQQVGQRGMLAGKDLADRQPRVVHVGERLDERQVEAPVATHGDIRGVPLAALARPVGALRDAIHDQPADVVAGARVLRPRVPETDDDLQPTLRRQHDRARSRSGRARIDGSSRVVPWPTAPR